MTDIKLEEFEEDERFGIRRFTGYRTQEGKNVPHGDCVYTSKDTLAREEGQCKHGWRDGTWRQYDENGMLSSVTEHRDGKRHGHHTWWYDDGTLRFEGDFVNDHAHGFVKHYYRGGVIENEIEYECDARNGVCKAWTEDGKLIAEGIYINDLPMDGTFVVEEEIEPSDKLPTFADYVDAVQERRISIVTYRDGEPILRTALI